MIIKKPTFHLHRRGRPGGSFGLRTYIFQVCLFSPGLPRAPTVAVLDESLLKSIMLGAFSLMRKDFFGTDMKEKGILITRLQQKKTFYNQHVFHLEKVLMSPVEIYSSESY